VKHLALIAAILVSAAPAIALEASKPQHQWVVVDVERAAGTTEYMDMNSLLIDPGNIVTATMVLDYSETPESKHYKIYGIGEAAGDNKGIPGKPTMSMLYVVTYDCANGRLKQVSNKYYSGNMGQGEVLDGSGPAKDWYTPERFGKEASVACAYSRE